MKISNYLASLGFADQPDYALLEAYLEGIPDMQPPLKQSHWNGYPVDSSGSAAVVGPGAYLPPPQIIPETHPSTSSAQLDSARQAQVCSLRLHQVAEFKIPTPSMPPSGTQCCAPAVIKPSWVQLYSEALACNDETRWELAQQTQVLFLAAASPSGTLLDSMSMNKGINGGV